MCVITAAGLTQRSSGSSEVGKVGQLKRWTTEWTSESQSGQEGDGGRGNTNAELIAPEPDAVSGAELGKGCAVRARELHLRGVYWRRRETQHSIGGSPTNSSANGLRVEGAHDTTVL